MEARIVRESDMFGRSITFWNTNTADLAATAKGPGYLATLIANNQKLAKLGAMQKGTKVTAQNAQIMALDRELETLAVAAEAIAQDVPGFDDLFTRPKHLTPREVMETAAVYLGQLAPAAGDDPATVAAKAARVAHFTDHGLAATFVADLQAQVTAIGSVKDTHEESREAGVASTAAIAALARDSRKQVKYLNAIAKILYKNSPDKLRAWESASHVERDPVHATTTPAPVPTPAK
jgi:hypothetical protein